MNAKHFLLFLLCITPAFALTASPASHSTQYHTGTEDYTLTLTNDEPRSLTLTLQATGPLRELITVPQQLTLAPGETKTIQVTLTMPDTTQPGILESGVLIEARPISAGTVSATSAVLHIIRIETPREGTHLAAELLSSSGVAHEPVTLTVALTNTGTQRIERAYGVLTVNNEELRTAAVALQPGETKNVVVSWTAPAAGVYPLTAHIDYGTDAFTLNTDLVVGTLEILITRIDTSEFRLGEPLVVRTTVANNWGAQLPVRAGVRIEQNGKTVASGQSTATVVQPQNKATLSSYLETTDVLVGSATLVVDVYYADKVAHETKPLVIGIDSLEPTTTETPKATYTVLVVLALLFVAVVSIIFIKRKRSTS